jgi:aspartyl-tRNA(Asn)/glutamyl-tRNA(Gln) amidotransferase subunit A
VQPLSAQQRELVEPPILEIAGTGQRMSAIEYRAVEQRREDVARRMSRLHEEYDFLITPQVATPAFAANHEVPPGSGMQRWWEWSPFTYPFNLTQQPCATMPCGFTAAGLPVAMQIVGAKFKDAAVLRAARAYEMAWPIVLPRNV